MIVLSPSGFILRPSSRSIPYSVRASLIVLLVLGGVLSTGVDCPQSESAEKLGSF